MSISPTDGGEQYDTPPSLPVPNSTTDDASLDSRGQPTNTGECGPAAELATEQILASDRIVFSADTFPPRRSLCTPVKKALDRLYKLALVCWLHAHREIEQVTVRCIGPQADVLLYFHEPQDVDTDERRSRWQDIAHVAYVAMPVRHDETGKTEVYRTICPTNSTRGAQVVLLSANEILNLRRHMRRSPFRTVTLILFGTDSVTPCPFCLQPGTQLSAGDRVGNCSGCGEKRLLDLRVLMLYPDANH